MCHSYHKVYKPICDSGCSGLEAVQSDTLADRQAAEAGRQNPQAGAEDPQPENRNRSHQGGCNCCCMHMRAKILSSPSIFVSFLSLLHKTNNNVTIIGVSHDHLHIVVLSMMSIFSTLHLGL